MLNALVRVTLLSVTAATLAACAGAEAEPRTGASPATTTANPTLAEQCEAFFARAAACTDQYIPALVDLRIELDKPAGITAAAQSEGRDAIIAKAMTEWAEDSQPAAVSALCERIAPSIPPDQLEAMRAQGEACMAKTDCGEFSTCAMALQRPRIAGQ
jgi:hypothetical protein